MSLIKTEFDKAIYNVGVWPSDQRRYTCTQLLKCLAISSRLILPVGESGNLKYVRRSPHRPEWNAIFDVTDPAHVKQEGSAQVDAPGSFDFVSSLGDNAELVRFRSGQGEAVLNLHKVKAPTLNTIQGLDLHGSTQRLGDDGFIIASQPTAQSTPMQSGSGDPTNYQLVDISNPLHPSPLADVKQVREEVTNNDTGTTFLLTADGLYLIRRPAVEEEYDIHEWQMSHPG